MPFDRKAEANVPEFRVELIFDSGKPTGINPLAIGPCAYIAMGEYALDERGRPMITSREMSFGALKGQVDFIKSCLDARVADAKARFMASGINI